MKRKVTSIVISVLCILLVICGGCSCSSCAITETQKIDRDSISDGYFKYFYIKKEDCYALVGDGDNLYPEELIIPAYYRGKEVKYIYYRSESIMFNRDNGPSFEGVEKLHFSFNGKESIDIKEQLFKAYPLETYFLNDTMLKSLFSHIYGHKNEHGVTIMFIPSIFYRNFVDYRCQRFMLSSSNFVFKENLGEYAFCYYENINGSIELISQLQKANMAYIFNYNDAPNSGYFYINNYEYGEKAENTPYEPQREGYKFLGWYKEPWCENKWDFKNDKLPEARYDSEGNLLFKETRLYAKWQKI